jgi:PucR-like helix-turn-helix protein
MGPVLKGRLRGLDLDDLVEEVIEAIRAGVPEYAQPLEGGFGRAVRTGVAEALTRFRDAVEGSAGSDAERWRQVYFNLGRGEARQGRTMEALLAAYRVGARVSWRRVAEAAAAAGASQAELTALAEAIFAYIDELSAISAEGYAAEQATAAGETQRRREALVRLLVEGAPSRAAIESAAAEAGWRAPGSAAVLLVREERTAALAARLGEGAIAAPLPGGISCAILPDGARAARAAARGRPAALGPMVELGELPRSLARAQVVLELLERGVIDAEPPVSAEEHMAHLIVHQDESLLAEHARTVLAPLDELPARSRERLLETLAAWVRHPGRPTEIARDIHVHPQTARYRLRRLRELVGDIDDPDRRFSIALALQSRP